MALRIVVAFVSALPLDGAAAADAHLRRVVALCERAEVRGARLCALGSHSLAFDFAPEDVEEALSLALTEHEQIRTTPDEVPCWAAGIAQGDMTPLVDVGSMALPSWGMPLVTASALARSAAAGEVLADAALPAARAGELRTSGARTVDDRGVPVHGLTLDPRSVWRRDPATVMRPSDRPVSGSALRAVAGALDDAADDGVDALLAWSAGEEDLMAEDPALPGPAKVVGPVRSLAIAALARGDVGEALITLHRSVREAQGDAPRVRSRAYLSLAVGLSVAGRAEDALFAALEALARARESADPLGERACLRFLSKLFVGAGHAALASSWNGAVGARSA